jgi:hypothetical protein
MKIKNLFLLVCATFLLSCGTHNLRTYKPLVKSEHSITVPAGGLYLNGKIKDVLTKNGWKLFIDTDTRAFEGDSDPAVKLTGKRKIKTKYQLFVYFNKRDVCFDGTAFGRYDISIIDNDNEEEVMTQSGVGCESIIVKHFEKWLNNE